MRTHKLQLVTAKARWLALIYAVHMVPLQVHKPHATITAGNRQKPQTPLEGSKLCLSSVGADLIGLLIDVNALADGNVISNGLVTPYVAWNTGNSICLQPVYLILCVCVYIYTYITY